MKYIISLFFSLLIHTLLWTSMGYYLEPAADTAHIPVEINYVNTQSSPQLKKKQIVTQTDKLETALDNLKEKVQLLSKRHTRVKEESVARFSGKTLNRSRSDTPKLNKFLLQKKWQTQKSVPTTGGKKKVFSKGLAINEKLNQNPWTTRNAKQQSRVELEPSTLSEHLPHVRKGGFTSLNTNQFLFYTFYSRINDQIRYKWVTNIRNYMGPITRQELKHLAKESRVTQLEIILNAKGEFEKAIIHKSSNIPELDQAAINTFKETTPYVNPPQELLEKDGKIHLKYGFYVVWKQPRFRSR